MTIRARVGVWPILFVEGLFLLPAIPIALFAPAIYAVVWLLFVLAGIAWDWASRPVALRTDAGGVQLINLFGRTAFHFDWRRAVLVRSSIATQDLAAMIVTYGAVGITDPGNAMGHIVQFTRRDGTVGFETPLGLWRWREVEAFAHRVAVPLVRDKLTPKTTDRLPDDT